MIFTSCVKALQNIFQKPFRAIFWKSLGLTLLALVCLWVIIRLFFLQYLWPFIGGFIPELPDSTAWLGFVAIVLFSLGLGVAMAFLIAPVTALIAGFFSDDISEKVEQQDYPDQPLGQAIPLMRSLVLSSKFVLTAIIGNLIAFVLLFVPGINLIAFLVINAYLLGREYFIMTAMRYYEEDVARRLYKNNAMTVFIAGLAIAAMLSIPLINLLTPIFAAALMTHLNKALPRQQFPIIKRTDL